MILVTGLGGIVAQTVALREFLILFSGNEFSIGVIIGSWVVWEALGALMGGKWKGTTDGNVETLILSTLFFSLLLPATIYAIRIFKFIAGIPPEIGVGLFPVFYASFTMLLPLGLVHGFLFSLLCTMHDQLTGQGSSSAGKVYSYEMLGTIAGGFVLNYFLIPRYQSFEIAMVVAMLNTSGCILIILTSLQSRCGRIMLFVTGILALVTVTGLLFGGTQWLHRSSIARQWQGKEVIYYENSLYQNIVVVRTEDQYTFFSDGLPLITTPVPDIAFVEEFAHIPLLIHGQPEAVLILSGGAGGLINEVLKYPTVKKVDYVEIDPALMKVIRRFSTPLTDSELGSPLVHLHYADGRKFIRDTGCRYDVVFVGLHAPYTLQANRFFTEEFFRYVKRVLKKDGVVAFTLTGSLSYYSKELRDLNSCMLRTLSDVFPFTFVLPGDTNLFLASPAQGFSIAPPAALAKRLEQYRIKTNLVCLPYLKDRFEKRWQDWFSTSMKGSPAPANQDFHPKALLYNIIYYNLLFSPSLKVVFETLTHMGSFSIIVCFLALFLSMLLLRRRHALISIPFALATTGFTTMVLELALILSFQIFYGYVFYEIGILITVFMGGMAAGSLFISTRIRRKGDLTGHIRQLRGVEGLIALFSLVLIAILQYLGGASLPSAVIRIIFPILLFVAGFLTGLEFPLANSIYLTYGHHASDGQAPSVGTTVGLFYSVDLVGGWIGGLFGGFVLFPMLGLLMGCIFLAALKLGSLLFLFTLPRK